jgi:hypothetical protein
MNGTTHVMPETAEPVTEPPEDESQDSVTELLDQLARELGTLATCEARLAASRHRPAVRRAARDVAVALLAGLAFLTAFGLANAAFVQGLSAAMSTWAAALVLAAAWTVVGLLLALFLRARARRLAQRDAKDVEAARAEAEQAVRTTFERFAPALTREIALAAVPTAGDVAGETVEAAEELIETADQIVETIAEGVPGANVVNQMWDVVLLPGRLGIRVATTVLRRSDNGG